MIAKTPIHNILYASDIQQQQQPYLPYVDGPTPWMPNPNKQPNYYQQTTNQYPRNADQYTHNTNQVAHHHDQPRPTELSKQSDHHYLNHRQNDQQHLLDRIYAYEIEHEQLHHQLNQLIQSSGSEIMGVARSTHQPPPVLSQSSSSTIDDPILVPKCRCQSYITSNCSCGTTANGKSNIATIIGGIILWIFIIYIVIFFVQLLYNINSVINKLNS